MEHTGEREQERENLMATPTLCVVAWNPNVRDPEPGMDGPILLSDGKGHVVTHLYATPIAGFSKKEAAVEVQEALETRLFPRGMPNEESPDGAWVCLEVDYGDTLPGCEGDTKWVWKSFETFDRFHGDEHVTKLVEKKKLPRQTRF